MASAYVGNLLMAPLFGVIADYISVKLFPVYLVILLSVMVIMHIQLKKKITWSGNTDVKLNFLEEAYVRKNAKQASYAHNKGLSVSPPAFYRLGVNGKLSVSSKKFMGGCKVWFLV